VPKDPTAYAAELTRLYKAKEFGRYWGLKQMFAELAYGYALTVHRSQGSTFKYVFVDVPNLQKALKKKNRLSAGGFVREGQQLAYVAFTRPSHRLFTYQ
jgi:ATP-dependent exoDNAse (exonuclease V) alpha subunit